MDARSLGWVALLVGGCEAHGAAPPAPSDQASTSAAAEIEATGAVVGSASAPLSPLTCSPACASIEACQNGVCAPACPSGEVFVPPTPREGFVMGASEQTQLYVKGVRLPPGVTAFDQKHRVVLTKPFCMDATEVPAREYQKCVASRACTTTHVARWTTENRFPDKPINNVSWKQARAYCQHLGKDLPTEAQWEWAARGSDGREYPWGNEPPTCAHADFTPGELPAPAADVGCHGGNSSPVGTHPAGDKVWPHGRLSDLAGNVWEWTLDNSRPYPDAEVSVDPLALHNPESSHIVRGGAWNRSGVGIKSTYRGSAVVGYQRPGLGFRCVRNAQP